MVINSFHTQEFYIRSIWKIELDQYSIVAGLISIDIVLQRPIQQ